MLSFRNGSVNRLITVWYISNIHTFIHITKKMCCNFCLVMFSYTSRSQLLKKSIQEELLLAAEAPAFIQNGTQVYASKWMRMGYHRTVTKTCICFGISHFTQINRNALVVFLSHIKKSLRHFVSTASRVG